MLLFLVSGVLIGAMGGGYIGAKTSPTAALGGAIVGAIIGLIAGIGAAWAQGDRGVSS